MGSADLLNAFFEGLIRFPIGPGSLGAAFYIPTVVVPPLLVAADGTFTTIDVSGATETWASGINTAGQIVGRFIDAGGKQHGFVRAADGTFTTIDVA